ncbi:MAG: small multi-drug export protein [Oscillospiraceae bacterium]
MDAIMLWLVENPVGEWIYTALMAMVPVVELRGAIPFGVGVLKLGIVPVFLAAVIGNMIPVPFIIIFIRRIFLWMRKRMPKFGRLVDKLEEKAHLKGRMVQKYRFLGLCILVAIPLPGTGAWTGALVAAFLDMRLREAVPSIFFGVVLAGIIVSALTLGVVSFI